MDTDNSMFIGILLLLISLPISSPFLFCYESTCMSVCLSILFFCVSLPFYLNSFATCIHASILCNRVKGTASSEQTNRFYQMFNKHLHGVIDGNAQTHYFWMRE